MTGFSLRLPILESSQPTLRIMMSDSWEIGMFGLSVLIVWGITSIAVLVIPFIALNTPRATSWFWNWGKRGDFDGCAACACSQIVPTCRCAIGRERRKWLLGASENSYWNFHKVWLCSLPIRNHYSVVCIRRRKWVKVGSAFWILEFGLRKITSENY